MEPYRSEQEIEAVVYGFESCQTQADGFKHREHLTVAAAYLRKSTAEQAFQQMCSGLLRFLDHHGVGRAKFDERLTMAWIKRVNDTIKELDPNLSLLEVTNVVVERLGDFRVVVGASEVSGKQ